MARRILFVLESAAPEAGSMTVLLPGLVSALRADGLETETVSEQPTPDATGEQPRTVDSASVTAAVRRADLVHVFGWDYDLARTAAHAARQNSIPYVITPAGALSAGTYQRRSWSDRLRGALGENRLLHSAAAITAFNEVEREGLRTRGIGDDAPILPFGIDVEAYAGSPTTEVDLPEPLPGLCMLLLSPIHPIEGVIPLLKAVGEMGKFSDGWHVVLAGPSPGRWRGMLEAAVRRKGADDRVCFVSASDVATQRAWLNRATILVAPALHPRAPVSVLQAMASGVPLLTTTGVMPSGADDIARVCQPSRPDIKSALVSLLRGSDDERREMAQRAFDAVRTRFSWTVLAPEYASLYENACAKSPDRRGAESVG